MEAQREIPFANFFLFAKNKLIYYNVLPHKRHLIVSNCCIKSLELKWNIPRVIESHITQIRLG